MVGMAVGVSFLSPVCWVGFFDPAFLQVKFRVFFAQKKENALD